MLTIEIWTQILHTASFGDTRGATSGGCELEPNVGFEEKSYSV